MEPNLEQTEGGEGDRGAGYSDRWADQIPVALVVEDEEMVLQLARLMLTMEGFRVLAAAGEDEAVSLAEQYPGRIDLLLADVKLRQGSGPGAASRLALRRPDLEIVYMSGYSRSELTGTYLIGADAAFLQKPFNVSAFRSAVRIRFPGISSWTGKV